MFSKFIWVVFIGFVALISTMVYLSVKQTDIHLVTKEYYKEEIAYQSTIDALGNTPASAIAASPASNALGLAFDSTLMSGRWSQGAEIKIDISRPQDAKKDKHLLVRGLNPVTIQSLEAGRWNVRISWTEAGKDYLWQKQVYI